MTHRPTVLSIAVVACALATFVHEGVGHGGACMATGGRPVALSSVHFECGRESALVIAGGTLANLAAGALGLVLLRRGAHRPPALRYFLWLFMTMNLLQAAGYLLFSGIGGIGDWAVLTADLHPLMAWRGAMAILGGVAYLLLVRLAALELRPFLAGDRGGQRRCARRLTLGPYLAGGVLACLAGLFNPVGMVLVGISAAASSFGGISGLAWMADLIGTAWVPVLPAADPPIAIRASVPWIAAAAVTAILFVAVLGPGLRFH